MEDTKSEMEKYSWILRSKQRQEIIELLNKPITPSKIADELDIHISQVSYSLSKFKEKDIGKLLNEDAKKGRLYTLTEEGRKILERLQE